MKNRQPKSFLLSLMIFGLPFALHPQMSANQTVTEQKPKQEMVNQNLLTDQDIQNIETLLTTIKERIDLMEHISAYKWNRGKPILEIDNEQQLITNISLQAKEAGIDHETAKQVFSKQLEAAQIAQINEFERLVQIKAGDVEEKLENPQAALAEVNSKLFIHLKEAMPSLNKHSADKILKVKTEAIFANVDPDITKAALEPFFSN